MVAGDQRSASGRRHVAERGHVTIEWARLTARMTCFEIAQPTAPSYVVPVLHARDDGLLEQRQERPPLGAVEVAEEPLDRCRTGYRDASCSPGAPGCERERQGARVMTGPSPDKPIFFEPIDEPHRARVREPEHAGEVIHRAASVDP